uniref:CCHC-type domain-containing protein n=1 Tax=Trichuris muris TaxID=70415 RepID=A0A5S6QMN4_TRIMR
MEVGPTNTSYRGLTEMSTDGRLCDLKLIPLFDGYSEPVAEWLDKVQIMCDLFGVADIAKVLPLRLAGEAFAVYQQQTPEMRRDAEKVKQALLKAFAMDKFVAYKRFVSRRLEPGEAHDVFVADLRRLASLAGGISDSVICCAFVNGLPVHVQEILRAGARLEDMTLDQLVVRARSVMVDYRVEIGVSEAGVAAETRPTSNSAHRYPPRRCYACGGANHIARNCPTQYRGSNTARRTANQSLSDRRRNWDYDRPRTSASDVQGNESREKAPALGSSRS